ATLAAEHPAIAALTLEPEHAEVLEVEAKYAGYVARQQTEVKRMAEQEQTPLPADLDYDSLEGLTGEAKEKLARLKPHTLGAATRIDGVRPPDIALLSVHLRRLHANK
ncbi:MAG: tRNA uridine-5-carboxymethylaminomethyl(34) synthesis enzyme MnmG, partial [Planctomycetota bacterium]|nr:tRNA uridine-5-carboxymethylaminomethyl(34) synthesis enzyme MnmG [Planctomycetota bacterium]